LYNSKFRVIFVGAGFQNDYDELECFIPVGLALVPINAISSEEKFGKLIQYESVLAATIEIHLKKAA
jgi:hypothetical protein